MCVSKKSVCISSYIHIINIKWDHPIPQIESTVKVARESLLLQIELYQKQGLKGSSEVNEQAKKTEVNPESTVDVNTIKEKPVTESDEARPKHEL